QVKLNGSSYSYPFYQYYSDATALEPALIANNWFMTPRTSATAGRPIYTNYSTYQQFYHNSAANYTGGTTSYACYLYASTSTPANVEFVNNIFANFGGGNALYINATTTVPMVTWGDYNNLYTTGANLGYAGTNQTNLSTWQTTTGLDSNSVSTDPFFSAPDFLLPGAPAMDNLGIPVVQVADDIFGNPRSFTTPDMGAVEYTPPQNDAGVIAISSPTSPLPPGSYPITVSIKNFGLSTLMTAYIQYSVNGGPASSSLWVGPLSPDSTDGPITVGNYTFPYGLHTLKVWTSNPNNGTDGNNLNDTATVVINICDITSGTYTIGDTSAGADYPTFQSAVNSLTSCGIGDTVIFLVDTGTYTEQVVIPQIAGAGPGARIIFRPANPLAGDVVLTYTPTSSTSDFVLKLNGADYVTFEDITIKVGSGATYGRTLYLAGGADYNEFLGCKIHTLVSTSSYFVPVYQNGSVDGHNLWDGCEVKGGYYSFYLYSAGNGGEGNTIINCDVIDWYYYGIYLQYQTTPIVKHNYVHNSAATGYGYAIRNYYCYGPFETSYNTIEFDGTGYCYGLYIYYSDGLANNPAKVYNNVVMVNSGSGSYGAYFYYATNVKFYHNTINVNMSSTSGYGLYMGYQCSNIDVVNNSITTRTGYSVYVSSSSYITGFSHMDYNNLYTQGASLAYTGSALANLAAWQAATTLDSNSISADPAFYTPTNLTPSVASVNDLGTAVSWITDDINGNPRNVMTPDMGAIEFDPLNYEAGLVRFVGPVSGCDLGNEYVAFEIVNRGAQAITDSLYASYILDGSSVIVTELVTDTINPNDTLVFTFATPVNVSTLTDTTFGFHGWIDLAGDPLPDNDSSVYGIISNLSPADPMVIGDTVQQGMTATLMVANPSPTQSYSWFDNLSATVPVHVGDTFITPALNTTTVYYVEGLEGSPFQDFENGPGTTTTSYAPAYGWYNYNWSAILYTSSEINTAGRIDSVSFYVSNSISYSMLNQKMWMAHTAASQFTTFGIPAPATIGTKVFEGNMVWTGPGWFTIALDVPFIYNGTDNLMIYWENWDGSYVSGYPTYSATSTTNYMMMHDYSDLGFPSSPTGSGGMLYSRPIIQLIGGDNGCPSDRVPDTAHVTSPIINVFAGNDTSMCAGGSVQLNVAASGGIGTYTYAWSPAGSLNNAAIANPIASPVTNTTYSVTVTDGNGDTGSDDIIVLVNPGPNVTLAAIPDICINYAPYTLSQGSPAGGVYSGPGVTTGIFYPGTAMAGTHTITYMYTDPATGCSGSATNTVFVDLCIGVNEIENGLGLSVYPNPASGLVTVTLYSEESS
ncbi:MAG TPA: right-handed parallel beta-helix repeat-containing protein, partial [Bacteroidales bacterium]|nr:right-handed parallel beta-helix repeat-containing protein [Bacteroidales bacterium]